MSGWRDPILAHFTPEIASVARLTIVSDPDELLSEPGVVDGIRERGFEIIPFDDHVRFRYAYEQRFRNVWDEGKETTLVVVLRAARMKADALPFDLLAEARRQSRLFSFSLAELFPSLQPQVLAELDRTDLDAVYAALQKAAPGQLGANATRDFILRHVFRIAAELIVEPSDLLRVLLRRHYSGLQIPPSIDRHLIQWLRKDSRWHEWPLEEIVPNRSQFLRFLEERWPRFLERKIGGDRVRDDADLSGPADLPFDHDDVRVYIDNLFIEGFLEPTTRIPKESVRGTWMAIGVRGDPSGDRIARLSELLRLINDEFPGPDADYRQWLQAGQRWSECVALRCESTEAEAGVDQSELEVLQNRIEREFELWLRDHYPSLSTTSHWPRPVMVHHIPKFLAHGMGPTIRHALVVVDGLSLDQWVAIRQASTARFTMDEGAVFAWVPTLTSVSRQAIFAAEPPFFFGPSIASTSKEPTHWARFWEEEGLKRTAIAYLRQADAEDDDAFYGRVREQAEDHRIRALAIVVSTVDQILHGTVTGTDGMHASVRHWAERGALASLVSLLLANGFEVTLTADHGNVEGRGFGKPNVGVTAEQRGERVHIFRDTLTRSNVAGAFAGSIEWPQVGLPEDYLPLIAPDRKVFVSEGKRTVAHGGICLEEVLVPFVRFTGIAG